jgi:hypothetical protein
MSAAHRCAALALMALAAGCDQTRALGSRYLLQQPVLASEGATIAVAADGSDLAGASLTIAPGDLTADATITLEPAAALGDATPPAAGPLSLWGPAVLELARPVELAVPYQLGPGQAAADLVVLVVEPSGRITQVPHAELAVDEAASVVRLRIARLGGFQAAAVIRCVETADCPADQTCRARECHTGADEADAGHPDAGDPDPGSDRDGGDRDGGGGDHDAGPS